MGFPQSASKPTPRRGVAWLGLLGGTMLGLAAGLLLRPRPGLPGAAPEAPPASPAPAAELPTALPPSLQQRLNHELRTPLNAIVGLTHLLLQPATAGRQQQYLQALQQASGHLLAAFTQLAGNEAPTVPTGPRPILLPFEPPLQVLVAEDNELNQLVARHTLEAWEVQVTLAADGQQAVAAALQAPFDVVLMDVDMPTMNGHEATQVLRQHFPDAAKLPIIGLTAATQPAEVQQALQAGMNLVLPKPVDPVALYQALALATGHPLATAELRPNWQLLEELANGNVAFLRRVMAVFLEQAPAQTQALQVARTAADLPGLASQAHKLKGQLAYFGFDELTSRLSLVERLAKAQDPAALAHTDVLLAQLPAVLPPIRARYELLPL